MGIRAVAYPQRCGSKDSMELRVVLGDMKSCQLKCPFCFTREQKDAGKDIQDLKTEDIVSIKIIRFTGGEPLLTQNHIDLIASHIQRMGHITKKYDKLFLVQTNAITASKLNLAPLFDTGELTAFEVSFKGTNVDEYRYLTFDNCISPQEADKIFNKQFLGYMHILNEARKSNTVSVLARLGIFHSSIKTPKFCFVFPGTTKLMFQPADWDKRFDTVAITQEEEWCDTFGEKVVVEKIKTPGDGTPHMGKRYRRIIELLKKKGLVREEKTRLPVTYENNYYYDKGYKIYQKILPAR